MAVLKIVPKLYQEKISEKLKEEKQLTNLVNSIFETINSKAGSI